MNETPFLSEDGLTILLFHGVIEEQRHRVRNYIGKHLEKSQFVAMVEWLKAHGTALSMDQVVERHRAREAFPARSFAITFDDGFENNHSIAAPILAALRLPATFYVTTDFVDRNAMSWIDRIEYAIEHARCPMLRLPWSKKTLGLVTTPEKIVALETIRARVKSTSGIDVEALVAGVAEQCGAEAVFTSNDPLDRKMTWAQVRELAANPLFTVGGHSHAHATLSFLSPSELENELDRSLALLRERAGLMVTHYAYPEGQAHCYSPEVIAALKARGIVCCPTAMAGVNTIDTDLFELRRIMPTPSCVSRIAPEPTVCAE